MRLLKFWFTVTSFITTHLTTRVRIYPEHGCKKLFYDIMTAPIVKQEPEILNSHTKQNTNHNDLFLHTLDNLGNRLLWGFNLALNDDNDMAKKMTGRWQYT